MLTAALYGFLASSGLIVGMLIGLVASPPRRLVASVVAFGSGVLVSTLTYDLMEEAFESGSETYVVGGFLAGAVIYVAVNAVLDRMAAKSPRREGREPQDVVPGAAVKAETQEEEVIVASALLVGAVLDGIPENAALGISLYAEGRGLGLVLLAAIFLGNLPESMSSSVAMRREGRSRRYIAGVWTGAAVVCVLASVAGYGLLGGMPPQVISGVLALAAGGILAMLANTMMPQAFREGGSLVALVTAVGFICALLLSRLTP
jgi:zinc transporter, ZIP family